MTTLTVFSGPRRIASGSIEQIAATLADTAASGAPLLVIDDATGRVTDLDLRGSKAEIIARRSGSVAEDAPGRGRPRLGVTAREVTLLPRHWDWLASQPGGASATLRRLVETASRTSAQHDRQRQARDTAYRAMQALGGDLPGYEAALRALYAGDADGFAAALSDWPDDLRAYVLALARADRDGGDSGAGPGAAE
jgi:uncharacterized protein